MCARARVCARVRVCVRACVRARAHGVGRQRLDEWPTDLDVSPPLINKSLYLATQFTVTQYRDFFQSLGTEIFSIEQVPQPCARSRWSGERVYSAATMMMIIMRLFIYHSSCTVV